MSYKVRAAITFLLLAVVLLSGAAPTLGQTNFNTEWERSQASSALPEYFDSNTRGIAYGTVDSTSSGQTTNERVYVTNDQDPIQIHDATNGSNVGTLNMGAADRVFDVEVTKDGVIIGCEWTSNSASDSLRFYRWDHEAASPTPMEIDGETGFVTSEDKRLCDKLTAVGSFSDNSVTLWTAAFDGETAYRFIYDGDQFNSTSIPVTSVGTYPKVTPKGSGERDFFVSGDDVIGREYDEDGTVLKSIGHSDFDVDAILYFRAAGHEYLLAHDHGVGNPNGRLFDISNRTEVFEYGTTPNQGGDQESEFSDVDIRENEDSTYTAFILTARYGVGAYTTVAAPLPVEMASFGVEADGKQAVLSWQTASETNNAGFEVQHQGPGASGWANLGFVESRASGGTTTQSQTYRFATEALEGGTHTFRLRQVDTDGSATLTEVRTVQIAGEAGLKIDGPNPVMQGRSLSVTVRAGVSQPVEVALYNALGQRVQTVASGTVSSGRPLQKQLSTENLSSGLYFLRVHGDALQETRRITVVR